MPRNEEQLYQFLLQSSLKGQKEALGELMRLLYNDLYSYSLSILRDGELSKDCIQNVFFDIWRKKQNLNDIKNVKSYLFTCIRREALRLIDQRSRDFNNPIELNHPASTRSRESELISEQQEKEQTLQLHQVLQLLTPKHREIIHLKFFEGMDSEEISEIMSIRIQSVYNLLSEALKAVREKMTMLLILFLSLFLF